MSVLSPEQAHEAAIELGEALANLGIATQIWPLGLSVYTDLFVFVGRLTGVYRWYEDSAPKDHPITDPTGAADAIAVRRAHLERNGPAVVTVGPL